jgi:hypothetical protein
MLDWQIQGPKFDSLAPEKQTSDKTGCVTCIILGRILYIL